MSAIQKWNSDENDEDNFNDSEQLVDTKDGYTSV